MKVQNSLKLFEEAQKHIPGGVNSPVRAFKSVQGSPLFINRAKGSRLWDADENEFIDYVGSWGPCILGHAPDEVLQTLQKACEKGLTFGAPHENETKLVMKIKEAMPSMQKVRLVSSGTEACMTAIRLARGYTRREKIIKFSGHYHGHNDMLLVKAGSGVATLSLPDCLGVPAAAIENTLVVPFNNFDALEKTFKDYPHDIACVILEPILGNAGFIRPKDGFLSFIREICNKYQSLLIFDEVITGFRVAYGGMQSLSKITPDLTTLAKIIGGGLPLAAFGGQAEIMDFLAPEGGVYQAGTLSGNPLAVAAGLKTLELLNKPENFVRLNDLAKKLTHGLQELATTHQIPFSADHEGGLFGFFFAATHPSSYEEAQKADIGKFRQFFHSMLKRGVYLAPSAFEAGFVSLAHSDYDITKTLQAAEESFKDISRG